MERREEEDTKQVSTESLASFNKQALGVPQTVVSEVQCNYTTSSGDTLYEKILVGYKPILFPTAVSENCCFDYRFTVRDLVLPTTLPGITEMYFNDIVVKLQDMFTQMTAGDAIVDGKVYSYMPYCTILAQDENGIETVEHTINDKVYKFVTSDRLVQRDSCPVFTVNSNLKLEKTISLEDQSNEYRLLAIMEQYDEKGDFVRRFLESVKSVSAKYLKDIQEYASTSVEKRKGRIVCVDVILCDILVFCKRTFNFDRTPVEKLQKLGGKEKNSVPNGWLTPEEKLKKFGKKGTYMADYTTQKLPNDLFFYVDMTDKSDEIISNSCPSYTVFTDENKLITPYRNQYAYALQIMNTRVYAK